MSIRHVRITNDSIIGYKTKVFDGQTGEEIPQVTAIELVIEPSKEIRAKLEVLATLDMLAVAEVSTICPYCNRAMPYEENQRLILQLTEQYDPEQHLYDDVEQRLNKREQVLKRVFGIKFPNAPKFEFVAQRFYMAIDWKYWFVGIEEKHIEWAKAAKECGLIDAYIVDYGTEEAEK